MSRREEYLDREAASWAGLKALLDAGRGSFGWPSHTVAGHVAFWLDRTAAALEAMAADAFEPATFRLDVDRENERRLPEWSAMTTTDARAALTMARDRMRSAWSAIREPDDAAAAWFAGDTFEHYDEHVSGATDGT